MPRRDEEPEWDTDSEEESGDEDGSFDEDDSEEEDEDGSDFFDEDDDEDDEGDDEEDDSRGFGDSDDRDNDDDDDGSEAESDLESIGDSDDDEDISEDSSEDEDPFEDEEGGSNGMTKSMSSGSLMNEPGSRGDDKPRWMKCVPAAVVAMGVAAAAAFLCCLCLIPFLVIVIPLAVLLGGNKEASADKSVTQPPVTAFPSTAPSTVVTFPPTESQTPFPTISPTTAMMAPMIREVVMPAKAATTIYRSGANAETTNANQSTMLVENGPAGDSELNKAYALVELELSGILGLDTGATSVREFLNTIQGASAEFCLQIAQPPEETQTYNACILPQDQDGGGGGSDNNDISQLTGQTATYTMPDDCLGGQTVPLVVNPNATDACADIAPLLLMASNNSSTDKDTDKDKDTDTDTDKDTDTAEGAPALRGRNRNRNRNRNLQGEDGEDTAANEGTAASLLLMIENPTETASRGTQFHSTGAGQDQVPTLSLAGDNTCISFVDLACVHPEMSIFCELVINTFGLLPAVEDATVFKTIFAPNNFAFENAGIDIDMVANGTAPFTVEDLMYHVVQGAYSSDQLRTENCGQVIKMADNETTTTLCGIGDMIYQVGSGYVPGVSSKFPLVIQPDNSFCYGMIHVVDALLVSSDMDVNATDGNATCVSNETMSITEVVCALPNSLLVCQALKDSAIADLLATGLYTVFVPSDVALEMLQSIFAGMGFDITDVGVITDILLLHVVYGEELTSEDLGCDMKMRMANGLYTEVKCTGNDTLPLSITGYGLDPAETPPANIIAADIPACNGVVHFIDSFISAGLPEDEYKNDHDGGDDGSGSEDVEYAFDSCSICGEGKKVTIPGATIEAPEGTSTLVESSGQFTCQQAQSFCLSGQCDADTCDVLNGATEPCGCQEFDNVENVLIAEADNYSVLLQLATAAGLVDSLATLNPITLFAPTNDAFEALRVAQPEIFESLQEAEWIAHLQNTLKYHLLPEDIPSSVITNGAYIQAVNGDKLLFSLTGSDVFVNTVSQVIAPDAAASNGVVHAIDKVLLPLWTNQTIADVAASLSELTMLATFAGQASDLMQVLASPGPYTVFAPSNSAITTTMATGVDLTSLDPSIILNNHIVEGVYPESAIQDGLALTTLGGEEVVFNAIGSTIKINGLRLVESNELANNGILHVIDGILLPADIAGSIGAQDSTGGAATQSCSICSGAEPTNPTAVLSLPAMFSTMLPAQFDGTDATCQDVETACLAGFCSADICSALTTMASETCGCEA